MWWTIYKHKKRSEFVKGRDEPYEAFVRQDLNNWSYLLALVTHCMFIPRFLVGWSMFIAVPIFNIVFCWFDDKENIPQWKKPILRFIAENTMRILMFLIGGVIGRRQRVVTDYSHWLGPNNPVEWDCGMYVINHISPLDVCIHIWLQYPRARYMGKREALNIPLASAYVWSLGLMLTGRDTKDSKEVRHALIDQLAAD